MTKEVANGMMTIFIYHLNIHTKTTDWWLVPDH